MNQSKSDFFKEIVLYAIPLLVFIIIISFFLPGTNGSNLSADAKYTYAYNIDNDLITNWHSSLFMLEGIIVKKVLSFFAISITGYKVIQLFAFFLIAITVVSAAYLFRIIFKNLYLYGIAFLLFFVSYYHNGCCRLWGLDQILMHLLLPLIAIVVLCYRSPGKRSKFFFLLFGIFILWHCCDYRKIFLISAPIILYAILMAIEKFRSLCLIKRMMWFAVSFGAFVSVLMPTVDVLFSVPKSHPITPMLVSDIKIAYLLDGKLNELYEKNLIENDNEEVDYTITSYWNGIKKGRQMDDLKEMYIHEWLNNPERMFVAKMLQIIQFYCGGVIPPVVREVVENHYPMVRANDKAWNIVFGVRVKEVCLRWMTVIMVFITVILSCVRIKKEKLCPLFDKAYVYTGLSVLVYFLGFIVVTPTPDYRFLMPTMFVGQMLLVIRFLRWLSNRKKSQMETAEISQI